MKIIAFLFTAFISLQMSGQEKFPDGTPIPDWFRQNEIVNIDTLGKKYTITDYGVANDSTILQTEKIQAVIDRAAENGGGVIIIPKGTFLSGSIFFKPKTHLYMEEGAVLKGSDDISNFAIVNTRIEGQSLKYFAALVNADKVNGFTISGKGTINGNGHRYWKSFWLRRQVIPKCTNMDELRPRLVYISNSNDVQISGVRLMNSPFWTTHIYRCNNIKLLNLHIFAPAAPVKAPSSDAIDIDVCSNVLVKNCYMSVNDDAVALKGGKGPWADKDPNNGSNTNIIIEDCTYGFCHSGLTCGSESIHNRNIILRRCKISNATRLSRYAATLRIYPGGRHHRRCQEHAAHQTVDTVLRPQRPQGHPPLTCQQRDAAQYQPELRHILQRQKVRPIRIEGFHFREFEYQGKECPMRQRDYL